MSNTAYRDFASLLDDLVTRRETGEEEVEIAGADPRPPTIPYDYLSIADELHSGRIRAAVDPAAVLYGDAVTLAAYELQSLLEEISIEPDAEDLTLDLPEATDRASIAMELGLDGAELPRLAEIRRRFAFANHPDRVPAPLRTRALERMQVANMLIDEAEKRLAAPAR
jgi:hypothetical protein